MGSSLSLVLSNCVLDVLGFCVDAVSGGECSDAVHQHSLVEHFRENSKANRSFQDCLEFLVRNESDRANYFIKRYKDLTWRGAPSERLETTQRVFANFPKQTEQAIEGCLRKHTELEFGGKVQKHLSDPDTSWYGYLVRGPFSRVLSSYQKECDLRVADARRGLSPTLAEIRDLSQRV